MASSTDDWGSLVEEDSKLSNWQATSSTLASWAAVGTANVYYNTAWLRHSSLRRALTAIPAVHSRRDAAVLVPASFDGAGASLLSHRERMAARRKVLAAWVEAHHAGGYGPFPRIPLVPKVALLVLHAAVVDWDQPNQDAQTFFLVDPSQRPTRTRRADDLLPIAHSTSRPWHLDVAAWRACVCEDLALVLRAAQFEAATKGVRLHLKLPPLGLGTRMSLWDGTHLLTPLLYKVFLEGVRAALEAEHCPNIAALELVDLTPSGMFTPEWDAAGGVVIVKGGGTGPRDLLDFTGVAKDLVPALVNPGDVFAWPGNHAEFISLNSMVGNNTTLRQVASVATPDAPLLQPSHWCPLSVRPPSLPSWWPPRDFPS